LIQIKHIRTQVDVCKVGRSSFEKLLLKLLKILPIAKLIDSEKTLLCLDKCLKKYDYEQSIYVGNMLGRYREKEVVPKIYFGKPQYLPFENITVAVPAMYHELQTALYGDYMSLPSEKNQVSHNIKIVSMRKL
jgi:lipopolysaccharide cholinephosphotransferase